MKRYKARAEEAVKKANRKRKLPSHPRSIPKWLRFEVLQRSAYKCVYCGTSSMETQLVVDHVHPVAAGGTNEPGNLVAACFACNQGKRATILDAQPERLQ